MRLLQRQRILFAQKPVLDMQRGKNAESEEIFVGRLDITFQQVILIEPQAHPCAPEFLFGNGNFDNAV